MPIHAGYHSRGYLPHIKVEGAAYFVTFRLADSLPREIVVRLRERREDLLARATKQTGDASSARRALLAWYATEVDSVLDNHTGAAWLREPRIAELTARALQRFNDERYHLHAWCVMPNHVHVVVRPFALHSLDSILHSWKSYTGTLANRTLGRLGQPFWQHESYDDWIRDDADLLGCVSCTENNPAKAGLCTTATDWPWSSAKK